MKTLFLMRHAKSSWSDTTLADIDRPLNARGLVAAPFMGKLMQAKRLDPYVILSSTAVRARHTATLAKEAGSLTGLIQFEPRIYEASPQRLRQVISEIDNIYRSALVVGHNPGMEGFIRFLTGDLEAMPTAAIAVINLNIDGWDAIGDGSGELQNLFRPREEMQ